MSEGEEEERWVTRKCQRRNKRTMVVKEITSTEATRRLT